MRARKGVPVERLGSGLRMYSGQRNWIGGLSESFGATTALSGYHPTPIAK